MATRVPSSADFSPAIKVCITPPPSTASRPTNVLILLHGLGDRAENFHKLGSQLALPETSCVTLQAPSALPMGMDGFYWGDALLLDDEDQDNYANGGFSKAIQHMKRDVIEDGLVKNCGYSHRNILLLGLGQGGTAALTAAAEIDHELGGIVSLGGTLPNDFSKSRQCDTPVLVLGGSSESALTSIRIDRIQAIFATVEAKRWPRAGDGMPRSVEEMLPLMAFFSKRLQSHQGVPKGSVQLAS